MSTSPTGEDECDGLTVEEWLAREMRQMIYELMVMEIAYETHQILWGVPCGPTLSMVYPPMPRGIQYPQINRNPLGLEDENGNKIFRY